MKAIYAPLLLIHLFAVATYFMAFGVEWWANFTSTQGPLRRVAWMGQYAMAVMFLTGGTLITSVEKDKRGSFLVTIVAFLVLAGLAGMAAAMYRKLEEGAEVDARKNLLLRLSLSAAILVLVSWMPGLIESALVVVGLLVVGLLLPVRERASSNPA